MAEEIIQIYKAEIEGFKSQMAEVRKQLADTAKVTEENAKKIKEGYSKTTQAVSQNLTDLKTNLLSIATAGGIAFSVGTVISFGKEIVNLSLQAEGVKNAFTRLNDAKLLDKLRAATKGTVSDLELMKAAINANNFQIPLDQLGKLLAFAQQRANETGQSVDYLVNSIVTGIARKSLPILDNLGLNTTRVREEFEKTGNMANAVGNIIDQEMGKAGQQVEDNNVKVQRLTASWDNFKLKIGDVLKTLLVTSPLFQQFNQQLEVNQILSDNINKQNEKIANGYRSLTALQSDLLKVKLENNIASLREFELEGDLDEVNKNRLTQWRRQLDILTQVRKEQTDSSLNDLKTTAQTLKYKQMSLDSLKLLAEQGDELAKKEIKNREAASKSWEKYQQDLQKRQEEIARQNEVWAKEMADYEEELNKTRLINARDFQKSLRTLSDEELQMKLDNLEIPDTLFYEIMNERANAEHEDMIRRTELYKQDQERRLQIARYAADAQIELENEVFNAFRAFSDLTGQLLKENAGFQSLFFAFEKILAIGQIITQLQIEKAKNAAANAVLGAAGVPITLAQNQAANIRAGVSIATIVAQAIPQLRFAEGTKDVQGGREGVDSVHALLMPHEMVFPVKKVKKYKPILNAIFDEKINPELLNSLVHSSTNKIMVNGINSRDLSYGFKSGSQEMLYELRAMRKELRHGIEYKVLRGKRW